MVREAEAEVNVDEVWLERRRAEIESARCTPEPGPEASEEERRAYAELSVFVKEAAEALATVEATLRERRIEESKRRQQQVQWEVVRLRLRKTMGRQSEDRRQRSTALVSRLLPSDRSLTQRMADSEWSEQRRYLGAAMETFRAGLRMLPPEEIMAESRILLDFFSVLQPPRPQDPASDHRAHLLLSEQVRELRALNNNAEKQLAMHTMAERALGSMVAAGEEN